MYELQSPVFALNNTSRLAWSNYAIITYKQISPSEPFHSRQFKRATRRNFIPITHLWKRTATLLKVRMSCRKSWMNTAMFVAVKLGFIPNLFQPGDTSLKSQKRDRTKEEHLFNVSLQIFKNLYRIKENAKWWTKDSNELLEVVSKT